MSRWIDVDALIEKLQQHHDFFVNAWGGFSEMPIQDKARCDELSNNIAEIFNAPSIDLVRCRECRCRNENCGMGEHKWCEKLNMSTAPDDYCSYAERKKA